MLSYLSRLAAVANEPNPAAGRLQAACDIVREMLGAEDAYILRAGDPHFLRVDRDERDPAGLEIKQKGLWLMWRHLVSLSAVPAGLFRVADRLVGEAHELVPGRPATHAALILPGDESNSEMLVVRGPWEQGLRDEQARALITAQPILAGLVANVLDRERHERQRGQLESIANIARAFSEACASDDVLTTVATALAKASGFDWVTISIYNDTEDAILARVTNFARHSQTSTADEFRKGTAAPAGPGIMLGVVLARAGQPALWPDVFDDPPDILTSVPDYMDTLPGLRKFCERAHLSSLGMFPLSFQGKVLGMVTFASSTPRTFPGQEVEFLAALAAQAATTLHGVRLYQELESSRGALRQSEERFRSLVQHASDLITVLDLKTMEVTYQSPSISRMLGILPDEVVGRRIVDLVHPDDVAKLLVTLEELMANPDRLVTGEARVRHHDGSWRHLEFTGTDQRTNPAIGGLVLNIRDISERKSLEQQLMHQALHDPLTRLANRTRFTDRLQHALLRSSTTHKTVAVLFMDLDNFKSVNDTLGHSAGDRLLTAVAERVESCIRPADTVARLGGDEFALLLEEVSSEQEALAVAQRTLDALRAPFDLEEQEILIRASLGIALSNGRSADQAEDLLRDADVAMYVAKSRGKGRVEFFRPAMQQSMIERLALLADIERALQHGEFVIHYQPVVSLRTGELTGVEALARWRHPTRGLLPPGEFIALAEESGAIIELGLFALREACRDLRRWHDQFPDAPRWTVSVNVSVKQLQQPSFVEQVAAVLQESGVAPESLVLEITESAMMHDAAEMLRRLHALKALGVRLAIDDFGTGYSSLSYLRRFPFDLLKIDKSFVDDVGADTNQKEVTRAIIELGRSLDMELVAEGIERPEQLAKLQVLSCELGQGFYFAEPMPPEEIERLLRRPAPVLEDVA